MRSERSTSTPPRLFVMNIKVWWFSVGMNAKVRLFSVGLNVKVWWFNVGMNAKVRLLIVGMKTKVLWFKCRYDRISPMAPVWRQIITPFFALEEWHFHKQKAHGPLRSPEKPVQINENIWVKLWLYIYYKTGPVVQEEKIWKFLESTFSIKF